MKYTKIPTDTFEKLQINAGFITTEFDPATGEAAPYFATTGGITFVTNPEFSDFGEDVDNCPKNTKELKRLISVSPVLSGTAVSVDSEVCKRLMGAATLTQGEAGIGTANERLVPSLELDPETDFADIWLIADYSNINGEETGKGIAVHLMNALNTAGFQWTTTDRGKGNFAFEFTGHVSIEAQTVLPYEVYLLGTYESGNSDANSDTPNPNVVAPSNTRTRAKATDNE